MTKVNTKVKEIKVNETKEQRFLRIAKSRVELILKSIRILGNCSNHNNYSYNTEQVEQIFDTIDKALNNIQNKFTKSKKEIETFKFKTKYINEK